jgi:hypothetical protein
VGNSPLRYRDPYGLWSVTVDGYVPSFGPFGPGGGVAFGQNPGGSPFFEASVGFGAGGGASVDPDGTSSGLGGRKPPEGLNVGFGVYGNVGAGVGPLNGQVSGDLGVNIPSQGPPEKYSNPPELTGNLGDFSSKWDVRFSGGAGGRVTFY